MALAFDLGTIIGNTVPIYLMTYSKYIFNTITKLSNVSQERVMIEVATLRESYCFREFSNIGFVLTKRNLSDPLTEMMNSKILENLRALRNLEHPVNLWIIN